WLDAGETVALVDHAGMIFLSSVSAWRYEPLFPLSQQSRAQIALEQQYDPGSVDRPPLLPTGESKPGADLYLRFQGETMLVQVLDIPSQGWRILAANDVAIVDRVAALVAATVFLSGALLFAVGYYLRERGQRNQANDLRAILENMSIGIAVFDAELRLTSWNS